MRLGFGLYVGDELYNPMYRIYFGLFRRLMLGQIQDSLVQLLSHPSDTQDRGYVYNALKAYLITTSYPDKSTTSFLPPVLQTHWLKGRAIDPERSALAQKQFLFYSEELLRKNPYPAFATPDETATQVSRAFLKKSATIEPLYQAMLAKVNSLTPTLVFNKDYPGSADVVVNAYPVPGAFTKPGWAYMQKAIQNPKEYFNGEAWVLGPDTYANLDPAKMAQELEVRYQGDFVKTWREFLHDSRVVGYGSIPDAATKLSKLSGNQSPLLELLCVVSDNTAVDAKAVSDLFQPPQQVVPAGCQSRLAAQSNAAYMDGLNKLLSSLQALLTNPASDAFRSDALSNALTADGEVRQMSRNFPVDKEGAVDSTTQTLLEDPIKHVQALIAGVPKEEANGGAKTFCGQFHGLMSKYPFQPTSTTDATVQEVTEMFKPMDGALWKLYQDTMQKYLVKQGSEYVAKAGTPAATPAFVAFFNRAAGVSAAFFPGAATMPQLAFSVKRESHRGCECCDAFHRRPDLALYRWSGHGSVVLLARLRCSRRQAAREIHRRLRVRFSGLHGPVGRVSLLLAFRTLAIHRLIQHDGLDAARRHRSSSCSQERPPATVSLILDTGGAPDVLKPGYFSTLTCPVPAVR